jgi:hypothetical protein
MVVAGWRAGRLRIPQCGHPTIIPRRQWRYGRALRARARIGKGCGVEGTRQKNNAKRGPGPAETYLDVDGDGCTAQQEGYEDGQMVRMGGIASRTAAEGLYWEQRSDVFLR